MSDYQAFLASKTIVAPSVGFEVDATFLNPALHPFQRDLEVVLDPFSGVGSTGYQAIQCGRKYLGIELKPSYYRVSIGNLQQAETALQQTDLFSLAGVEIA